MLDERCRHVAWAWVDQRVPSVLDDPDALHEYELRYLKVRRVKAFLSPETKARLRELYSHTPEVKWTLVKSGPHEPSKDCGCSFCNAWMRDYGALR